MDSTETLFARRHEIQVVMLPLPAQRHLNHLLQLSMALFERGLNVLFVTTCTHINQARHRVQGWDLHNFPIHFHEFPMPSFSDQQPDLENKEHTFPLHFIPLFESLDDIKEPFVCLIQSFDWNRVVIVHDPLLGWVQTVAAKYGAPAYIFYCFSAYFYAMREKGLGLSDCVVSSKRCLPEIFLHLKSRQQDHLPLTAGHLMNTFRALESQFMREEFCEKPLWALGPLLPQSIWTAKKSSTSLDVESCLRWLDCQHPASVVYVFFGSASSLSRKQLQELARGLEASQKSFLWVVRIADNARFMASDEAQMDWISELLPEGYEGRIVGRGFLVRNWAPQLDILSHKDTGGFVTHCGWNSTLESINTGVPMVAWPLHFDQFANSILVARELKVGVEVKKWTKADENELVMAEEVEKAIRRVMAEDGEGLEMRSRAKELGLAARSAVAEEGSSWKELESFIHVFNSILNERNNN